MASGDTPVEDDLPGDELTPDPVTMALRLAELSSAYTTLQTPVECDWEDAPRGRNETDDEVRKHCERARRILHAEILRVGATLPAQQQS